MKKMGPYIGCLFAILFVSIIGYLAVYSHIDFFKKKNSPLNVYVSKVTVLKSSEKIVSKESINGLLVSLDVDLVSKDGKAIYSIDIKNDGDVQARLDDIKIQRNNGKAIKYSYENFKVDEVIEPGDVKTLKVVLEGNSIKNISNTDLKGRVDINLTFVKNL